MQATVTSTAKTQGNAAPAEPVRIVKRIGSTVYTVAVHYSRTSKETMRDKVLRLIESEVRESA